MRLVRLGQQPSRVAEDVRAALASLGRGSTVIGGVALVGARPTGDRPVEAVVVLPAGVLVVIGVDLPDPALRLEAPLSGPWKADGWPLVHGDDVNPATEALDLSQECERRIAELGGGPVGTIVAVGPYVETVDQPPGDLAGPVRVLHPTPTTMLAATVSLATARHPRSVDQARALISALAPNAPELSDEVLRGEGFVRFADDVPVPPGPRSAAGGAGAAPHPAAAGPGVAPDAAVGAADSGSAAAAGPQNGSRPGTASADSGPAPAVPGTNAGSSTAAVASAGTTGASAAAAVSNAATSGAAGTAAEPGAAGASTVPGSPGPGNATPDSGRVGTGQPAAGSAPDQISTSPGSGPANAIGTGAAGPGTTDATPAGAARPNAAGSGPAGSANVGSTADAVPGGAATTAMPKAPAGAGNTPGLPVFPGATPSGPAGVTAPKAAASPSSPSAAPKSAPPVPRPKIIAVRPPRPEIPSIELESLSEAPTESTDPPEAPTEKMPSPAKPQGTGRPRGAVPPIAPVHVPGPSSPPRGAPQPPRPAPAAAGPAAAAGTAAGAGATAAAGAGPGTAAGAGPNTPAGPGQPASRTVKWVPIAAIVLLVVLVVSAIVVATSGSGDTAAAPPASSAAPSSVPSPAPSSAKSSAPPAPTLTFEPRASSADQKCASHAFGDVQASLQQTSCSGVRRASYTALVDGRPAAVTVAVVEFPDAGQANRLKEIADNPGGGGILDVATETGKWPSGPPQFDGAAYASKIDGNGVRLVQAVWQPGPSTADDPGLARAAKGALDLQLPS